MRYTLANIADVYQAHPKLRSIIQPLIEKKEVEQYGEKKTVVSFSKGIFFTGKTGRGKTYALYAIRNRLWANGASVSDVENYAELLLELRDSMSERGKTMTSVLNSFVNRDHVFLDDVGVENHTQWSQEIIYFIVNRVYERGGKLFIATNLTPQEFAEKYGDRISDRVSEMCEIINLDGKNLRG